MRKDDPWNENLGVPDIRGWRVADADGSQVGYVEAVVVDRQNNELEAVMTGANERFRADEIDVNEGTIRVRRSLRRVETPQAVTTDAVGFEESYRQHFDETYRGSDYAFEDMLPSYRLGRELAYDADYAGRPFRRAEADLRAHHVARGLIPDFTAARSAVECGYRLAHGGRPYEGGGLAREERQMLDKKHTTSARTGAAMSTMTPRDD